MSRKVRPHLLRPNEKMLHVRHVAYFDIETWQVKRDDGHVDLPFRLAVLKYVEYDNDLNRVEQTRYTLHAAEDLAHTVCKIATDKTPVFLLAHNASFDVTASHLLHNIAKRGWTIEIIRAERGSLIIRARHRKHSIIILDSLNFMRGSIEQLGALIGMPKLKVDFESTDDRALEEYCAQDVEILQHAFEHYLHFVKDNDFGKFGFTISAQALNAFRHRFMHTPVHVHANEELSNFERLAYGGGFTVPFRLGDFRGVKIYKTDVNSMYPHIMATEELPTRFLRYMAHPSVKRLEAAVKYYAVIADVTIHPKSGFYRRVTTKGTIYPTYRFRTVLCTPEVKEALQENAIIEVHKVALYKKSVVFDKYVEGLYAKRIQYKTEGNAIYERLVKLMLNSLYGKFGARNRKWTERQDLTALHKYLHVVLHLSAQDKQAVYFINGTAYAFEDDGDAENTFVALAAHVTAYGRMRLKKLIEAAGIDNVFYTDTDSLFVNEEGLNKLKPYIDSSKLGMLKIEEVADDLIIWGKKDYYFHGRQHTKGVSHDSTQLDSNTYIVANWPSVCGMLNTPTIKTYTIYYRKKRLDRTVTFADVKDGRVVPFTSPPTYDPEPLVLPPLPYSPNPKPEPKL